MLILIAGLLIFLGVHSINIAAPARRHALAESLGATKWKLIYSVVSLLGLLLIINGYAAARMSPTWLWMPPTGLRHLALLLTVPAFILLVAAYVPGNRIKAKLGHPMYVAVKIWAFAHLLANGSAADVLLFGSFLIWAVAGFAVSRRRDRVAGIQRPAGTAKGDITTVVIGLVSWAVFAMFLHTALIGVSPLP
ncbi:MAG: NnrU family protein [Pseudohongiella sp.]|nr:NnrU family protein [Pseudohongiella sp.]MDO9520099.1 NnrU family protein [Pseudohongiella sp.]MDP2128004.1 NnrU family protein [Pseudohongiella sp.]